MILTYYDTTRNFGDLLNPLIFHHYLPNFFDNDPEIIFLGIGTILGLKKGTQGTKKIIVFSSGYAAESEEIYGDPPILDDKYEIICVRGPLTAEYFDLNANLAVSDGALLLKNMPFPKVKKEYDFAYMPHHVSEGIYHGWRKLIEKENIHYISPQDEPLTIIEEIRQSKLLITEAMHGAIVADSFRIPWIPVRTSAHINYFKWQDWASTLNIEVDIHKLPSLFCNRVLKEIIREKYNMGRVSLFNILARELYKIFTQKRKTKKFKQEINQLKSKLPLLSKEEILNKRVDELLKKIEYVKKKYS
ncbi:MAG: polysaccharide pyruvyl transferase family protein [Bacteroidales bacterium]